MTYLTIDEINSNPIYSPPTSWINGELPFLEELTGQFHFKTMNGITLFEEEKYRKLKKDGLPSFYPRINKFNKFVYVNLPTQKTHKGSGCNNSGIFYHRFNNHYNDFDSKDYYCNYYEDRFSLKKKDLMEWAKINNLKFKKSMKINELVNIIRNMD